MLAIAERVTERELSSANLMPGGNVVLLDDILLADEKLLKSVD